MRHGRLWLTVPFFALAGWTFWAAAQAPDKPAPAKEADEESEEDAKARGIAAAFKKALENNPRRGTALDRLYGYHVERGSLDAFVQEYAERVKKDPKDGVAWMVIGLAESQRSRDGAAVVAFQKAEETLPTNAVASYYLGQCLVLIGRPDAAAEAFERAITRKPNRNDMLDAFQALGRVYQRAQKTDKALEVWNRLEKQYPDDVRVQEQIATTLVEEGQYEQALPRLEKLAKNTDDKYRQATLRMDVADLKVKLKKSAEALADFEKLLGELNPESWLYRDVRRRIEDVFLRNDDLAGLAKYYEAWLQKNATDVEAIARLAKNLAAQGKGPDARKWLEKGIEVAPSNKALRTSLIEQLAYEGNFADAAKQYEAMEKADPGNPDIFRDWGKLLMRETAKPEADRRAGAVLVWKRILEKKPTDPVTTSQVADLLRQAGAVDDAIALYKKAIELAPTAAQYREYLGEYYHSLKRSKEALDTWRPIAEGANRNAKNLARLGEVYAGFGYRKEAIAVFAEAIQLEKDDYNLLMTYADVLAQEGEADEALKQLDLAAKFTSNAEEVEGVLAARIKIFQVADKLPEQIDKLSKELAANPAAKATDYLVLARYFEANRQLDKAVETITKAAEKDAKSLAVLAAAARIHESGGNMLAAADANRKLATLDRRFRTEYLQQVAALEQRLGKRDDALKTAKEVLASAPGNPEVYKWYSEMCFQLGDAEEGLEALRRSVRANPADPQGLVALANALVERVRPGEAIELLWRALEKTNELEGKLSIIDRLSQLYLEQNQFDKLMERLERERRDQEKNRELTMCIAQAFQTAGDLGASRLQLERLLTENTRDTNLLGQLSGLCEQEGDVPGAMKYQRQLAAAAPQNFEAQVRLAQLLLKAGEGDEAADVWVKQVAEQNEPHRNLQAIDTLVTSKRPDPALAILSRMLVQKPGNWELLYREGAILAERGKKEDAAARFKAILALKLPDDELGEMLEHEKKVASQKKDDKKGAKGTPPALRATGSRRRSEVQQPPLQRRMQNIWNIRYATGIESRNNYSQQQSYTPKDFGEARMAALGWLYEMSRDKADGQDKFVAELKKAKAAPNAPLRALWDWHYLQSVRWDNKDAYERATALAKASDDPAAQFVFLTSVGMRTEGQQNRRYSRGNPGEDKTPPLPDDQLKYLLDTYKKLKQLKPEWVTAEVTGSVITELKRAKKDDDQKALYAEMQAAATTPDRVATVIASAVELDDLPTVLAMFKKMEQLQGPVKSANALSSLPTRQNYSYLVTMLGKRMDAKKYADALSVLDFHLTMTRKQNLSAPRSASASSRRSSVATMWYISLYANGTYGGNNKQITFPTANEYYDSGSLEMLYNAFELYKKADLSSDLFAHFQKQLAAADGMDKLYLHLAVGYMRWWNEEKDEALTHLSDAALLGQNDHNLTLEIAALREQNNELPEALALVDSISPTDHQVMQRREETALRLAERTGNIERARQAAERLFGLRLDADKQLELAGKMHRLGMHQLAETVLARAQRQAGNKTATLLRLMNAYQTQGQTDQAVLIAKQILRKAPVTNASRYRNYDEGDGSRGQAIGVLARSGQLKELVERAEAQLKTSPKSVQIHQTLLGYYQASNDKDKQKATLLKLAELKPDDAALLMQIANTLQQNGDKVEAMKYYAAAIKKDPTLFQNNYWEIQRLFSEQDKFEELVAVFDQVDLKKFNNYWTVIEMVTPLLEQDKTREIGMRMFKKAWDAFPAERAYILGQINREEMWKMPELYTYVKQAVIPREDTVGDSWDSLTQVSSYGQNGQATTVTTRMFSIARKQERMAELRKEIEDALAKKPDWLAGKALLAVIDIQTGQKAKGIAAWNALFGDKKNDIPAMARFTLAQELEYYAGIEEDVVKSLEAGFEDVLKDQNSEYSYSPARRLIWWYEQLGRIDDAKKALAKVSKVEKVNPGYSGGYWEYREIQDGLAVAQDFARLGDTVEAVRQYQSLLSNRDRLDIANSYYGGNANQFTRQVEQGLKETLKKLKPESLPAAVATLLTPQKAADGKPALDLMVTVDARGADKAALASVFATAVQSMAKNPTARGDAVVKAAAVQAAHPKDLTVAVANAVVSLADDKPEAAKAAVDKLTKLTDDTPLEPLPPGAKANSRQRAEALTQVNLWLAARECLKKDALRAAGEQLGSRAVAAARRQAETKYAVAILREWGQIEHDRKDNPKAEAKWAEMLDLLLPKPPPAKAAARPVAPPLPGAMPSPAQTATPATPVTLPAPQSRIDDGRPTHFAQIRLTPPAVAGPAPAPASAMPTKNGVPVLTTDQFQQVYEVAVLAADNKLPALSLKAMKDAVKGGPPVEGKQDENRRRGGGYTTVVVGGLQYLVEQQRGGPISVDTALLNMVTRWKKLGVPAADMYEVLAAAVFPDSRPAEMFLTADVRRSGQVYTMAAGGNSWTPITNPPPEVFGGAGDRGLAGTLAQLAIDAGKVDDLNKRIASRANQPLGEMAAKILSFTLAAKAKDDAKALAILKDLGERAGKDTSQQTLDTVSKLGQLALDNPALAPTAEPILQKVAMSFALAKNTNAAADLGEKIVGYHVKAGNKPAAYALLKTMETTAKTFVTPDASYYERIAAWYLKVDAVEDALKNYAQHADLTTSGGADPTRRARRTEPTLNSFVVLVKLLAALPADKRYAALKTWTLPGTGRKSVRYYVGDLPGAAPPEPFVKLPPLPVGEFTNTMVLLTDAATECGKLDELLAEADKVAADKVENADLFRVLAYLRAGKGKQIEADVKAFADAAVKRLATKEDSNSVRSRYDYDGRQPIPFHASELLFARLCVADPAVAAAGERLLKPMHDRAQSTHTYDYLWRVREAMAGLATRTTPDALADALPPRWYPVSKASRWFGQDGAVTAGWCPTSTYLLFDTPLAGTFEFSADVYQGAWKESHGGYAGVVYQPCGDNVQTLLSAVMRAEDTVNRPQPKSIKKDAFNRMTLRVTPTKVTCLWNGEVFYEDTDPSAVSPWLVLFAGNGRQSLFRNPALTGSPEVPAEVKLTNGSDLAGWLSYYPESLPRPLVKREAVRNEGKARNANGTDDEEPEPKQEPNYDWQAKDGELVGRRLEDHAGPSRQSKLSYFRPLRPAETVRYEFYYEAGKTHAHPSVGRVAFLLDPDGVKLHWLTDSSEDWTGLPTDNAVPAPAAGKVALKEKDWNAVTLTTTADAVTIALNGTPVYEGKRLSADLTFGVFHYRDKSAVRVRNVVLTGGWPKKLDSLDAVAFTTTAPSPAVAKARRQQVGVQFYAGNPGDMLAKVKAMPPAERYAALAAFVLPGPTQPGFQLAGVMTPQDVLGVMDAKDQPPGRRVFLGAKFEAPCLALVAVAKDSNKLDELTDRVTKAQPPEPDPNFDRDRKAMLALVKIAKGDDGAAAMLAEIVATAKAMKPDEKSENRWADYVVATAALDQPALAKLANDLSEAGNQNWEKSTIENKPFDGRDVWARYYRALRARAAVVTRPDGSPRFGSDAALANWVSVPYFDSYNRAQGRNVPHWTIRDNKIVHHPGHEHDYLFLKTPLRGNFELTCDLRLQGWAESHVRYGGYQFELAHDSKTYKFHSTIRLDGRLTTIQPPLPKFPNNVYLFKMTVKDGVMACFVGDRKLHEERIGTNGDPWLGLHSFYQVTGETANLKITGDLAVPESVDLFATESLGMWRVYLGDVWTKRGEEVFHPGQRPEPRTDGKPEERTFPENAMYYMRPLLEDGSVEYEFYYDPDKTMAHPMLDRLVVVVEPDGAKLHWLTDSWHDKSGVKFDNLTPQAKPTPVPLKVKQWNKAKLSVTGDTLALSVNGTPVFERAIESTNQRTFGFFHYSDRTEARVRNAIMRGDWGKTVPTGEKLFEVKK